MLRHHLPLYVGTVPTGGSFYPRVVSPAGRHRPYGLAACKCRPLWAGRGWLHLLATVAAGDHSYRGPGQ
ncbi:hypothetical protein B296_00005498 [Ensete ventricosum]|uniref:Uncharacterized protein n=1 Tax=Ensete ventricosum TaxID=4639 RepID=A0A427B9J9_ENSVE|nr:hypothetical protein B296_00005498 [Ensete ventricosum]